MAQNLNATGQSALTARRSMEAVWIMLSISTIILTILAQSDGNLVDALELSANSRYDDDRDSRLLLTRAGKERRSADVYSQIDYIYPQYEIVGPRCIPQTSVDKRYNPYHASLISRDGAQVRRGYGRRAHLGLVGLNPWCLVDFCTIELEGSVNVTARDTLSISGPSSRSQSVTLGKSRTDSSLDSISRSITQGVEDTISNVDTTSSDLSISRQLTNGLSSNHQRSTSVLDTHGGATDKNAQQSSRVGPTGTKLYIQHAFMTGEQERSTSFSRSENFSNSRERSEQDSVGKSSETLKGSSQSSGSSYSKMSGRKKSYSASDTKTSTDDTNRQTSNMVENLGSKTEEKSRSQLLSVARTAYPKIAHGYEKGTCKRPVCKPTLRSAVVPYLCASPDAGGDPEEVISEIHLVELSKTSNLSCVIELIDCKESVEQFKFQIDDDEYYATEKGNALEYGRNLQVNHNLTSVNNKFRLMLAPTGELRLTQNEDTVIWSNEIKLDAFKEYRKRARLNDLGHLLVEVSTREMSDDDTGETNDNHDNGGAEPPSNSNCRGESIFSKVDKYYRCKEDDWTVIWSSAAIENQGIQIGVARQADEQVSYKLVVSDKGELRLFDAYAVMIWCTGRKCQHRAGYRYPRHYLMPTNMMTERVENDSHNTLPSELKKIFAPETLYSCEELSPGEAIQSGNKRFHAYLSAGGSLVVKDGERTMWDSLSSNLNFARGPYKLILTPVGQALIVDEEFGNRIWTSGFFPEAEMLPPFKMRLHDSGELAIYNGRERQVWSTWPTRKSTSHYGYVKPVEIASNYCSQQISLNMTVKRLILRDTEQCISSRDSSNVAEVTSDCTQPELGKLWQLDVRSRTLRPGNQDIASLSDSCLSHSFDRKWFGIAPCNAATSLRLRDHWLADGSRTSKLCIDDFCWSFGAKEPLNSGAVQQTNVDWRYSQSLSKFRPPPVRGFVHLSSLLTSQCFLVYDGWRVRQQECKPNDVSQLWEVDLKTAHLVSFESKQCLLMDDFERLAVGACSTSKRLCTFSDGHICCQVNNFNGTKLCVTENRGLHPKRNLYRLLRLTDMWGYVG